MKRIVLAALAWLLVFFVYPSDVDAQSRKNSKPKTVKVRSYTTKKGKRVKSYYRSKPTRKRRAGIQHTYFYRREQAA